MVILFDFAVFEPARRSTDLKIENKEKIENTKMCIKKNKRFNNYFF